ncbi:MAG TPA: response regulator [Cyclobacteriaceae bacterium]|nr:response regulator [Cyclobacteriaceae bacterium]
MINVLLVEDNPINQLVAVKMLQRWGMEVTVANHGQEALGLVGSKPFELVLMDLDMPVMDGYESTRRIRQMDGLHFKTLPIIAFTASEVTDSREKAFHAGMTDFITKPLQQVELQTTIEKHVYGNMKNDKSLRPLHIDFDQHTDGDVEFKKELVSLMMEDIAELQKSLEVATRSNNPDVFLKGRHKSKTTVEMVNDKELNLLLEELEARIVQEKYIRSAVLEEQILLFNKLSTDVLESLSELNQ